MFCLGTMCHGPLTYGRLLYTSWTMLACIIGGHFEEKELMREAGASYQRYAEIIPNRIMPDVSVLFAKETDLEERRQEILKSQ